jgi:hypothetical protein
MLFADHTMAEHRQNCIWTILKMLMFISFVKYSLIGVQYLYFVSCISFPLHNVAEIVQNITFQGSTTASPINKISVNTKLIYMAENICVSQIPLLIVVKSAVKHFERRRVIRRTWGNLTSSNARLVFILGYNKYLEETVDQESYSYNDIVQGSFIDSYTNNTYKTIFTYNWIVQFCLNSDHVLFVDDDFYVHIPNVLKYLEEKDIDKTGNAMYGRLYYMAKPIRHHDSKWYISESEYPFDFWSPYLSGGSILANVQVVQRLALAIPYVRFVWIDDAFIGIVASKIDVKLIHEPGFACSGRIDPDDINGYLSSHGYSNSLDLVSAHKTTKLQKRTYWTTVPWYRQML